MRYVTVQVTVAVEDADAEDNFRRIVVDGSDGRVTVETKNWVFDVEGPQTATPPAVRMVEET